MVLTHVIVINSHSNKCGEIGPIWFNCDYFTNLTRGKKRF